ncbi:MAG: hypothetical protein L0Y71_02450 [Gemmataceae bacterium]|nr:hypothetical protein [Gemmataceae bacterium]
MGLRCRHHTDLEGLRGIEKDFAINPARHDPVGVDVEAEPFGPVNPFARRNPKDETGANGGGAYVEFDLPANAIPRPLLGPRNNARIPTDQPLRLDELHPTFVALRWWQVWKWWGR